MAQVAAPIPWQDEVLATKEVGQWRMTWRRLRRHKLAMIGLTILLVLVVLCLLAPWIAPYSWAKLDLVENARTQGGPTAQNWFGVDEQGRDTLTRLLYAGRISLFVAITATILSTIIGVIVGAVAGFYGRWVEAILMRFTDVMLALPLLPLLLIFSRVLRDWTDLRNALGKPILTALMANRFGDTPNGDDLSFYIVVILLVAFGWMPVARLVHGSVLSLKNREFTEATRALGAGGGRIIVSHLIPNSLAPIIVAATLGVGQRIILEAVLSFLGLGIDPSIPSWGSMLAAVQSSISRDFARAFFPGACIFLTVLAFNFLGDGLRDALDPRLKV